MGSLRFQTGSCKCQRLATPDVIVISSVAAEGAEGTTGGEASDDSSITVVQIGQNGEYLGTARLPAQTEATCYTEPIGSCRTESLILPAAGEGGLLGLPLALGSLLKQINKNL
ncbi:hypothetical protein NQZ68_024300 [Dissostichus eleginoides]|nr:hypothetical protein NQZ68_024300 [Dissostichus eleginoides]